MELCSVLQLAAGAILVCTRLFSSSAITMVTCLLVWSSSCYCFLCSTNGNTKGQSKHHIKNPRRGTYTRIYLQCLLHLCCLYFHFGWLNDWITKSVDKSIYYESFTVVIMESNITLYVYIAGNIEYEVLSVVVALKMGGCTTSLHKSMAL